MTKGLPFIGGVAVVRVVVKKGVVWVTGVDPSERTTTLGVPWLILGLFSSIYIPL